MRSRAKGIEEGSTNTNNHSPISGWCFFWDSCQCNRCQASMRNFTKIKPRSWQCEKCTSIKVMWWLWKVTCAWIEEYFRILYKSIGHIQSNKKIWGENERDTCVRENLTLAAKEVLLYGGRDKKKSQNMDVLSIQGLMGKLKVHEERVNEIQEDVGARALFSK